MFEVTFIWLASLSALPTNPIPKGQDYTGLWPHVSHGRCVYESFDIGPFTATQMTELLKSSRMSSNSNIYVFRTAETPHRCIIEARRVIGRAGLRVKGVVLDPTGHSFRRWR